MRHLTRRLKRTGTLLSQLVPPRRHYHPDRLLLDGVKEKVSDLSPLERQCLAHIRSGAMSYGSISGAAHETIARGVNSIALALHGYDCIEDFGNRASDSGPFSNSGEGGELPHRDKRLSQSRIRQVASGRFGVNGRYLANAHVIEIKVAQGAKPALGGELPGKKVSVEIATARLTQEGITLKSPPPHHDIYSIEDLKQLIFDCRSANPYADIGVKLAAGLGQHTGIIAAGVAKAGADLITLTGPGGTGATPFSAKYEFTHSVEPALASTHNILTEQGLRKSVQLIASGNLHTGQDALIANFLGADYVEFGTPVLVSLGCVDAEVCHNDTCPTGVATMDPVLVAEKFKGQPEHVANHFLLVARSWARNLDHYGYSDVRQAVGDRQHLRIKSNPPVTGLEQLLETKTNTFAAFHQLKKSTGSSYEERGAIQRLGLGESDLNIAASNQTLSFGARIGYEAQRDPDLQLQLAKQPAQIRFHGDGAMGQSFGMLTPEHVTLQADIVNDGFGKSLDGGTLCAKVCGNQAAYGATRGMIYTEVAGDRFALGNRGAYCLVGQVGYNAANFTTGGTLAILGFSAHYDNPALGHSCSPVLFRDEAIGPNFAAGFTGGKVIMPAKLMQEVRDKQYLASTAQSIPTRSLKDSETEELLAHLRDWEQRQPNAFHQRLLAWAEAEPQQFQSAFIVMEPPQPKPKHAAKKAKFNDKTGKREYSTSTQRSRLTSFPQERDACGVACLVNRNGEATNRCVQDNVKILENMAHRGAVGIDERTGDGCGILFINPHDFFAKAFPTHELSAGDYAIIAIAMPHDFHEAERAEDIFSHCMQRLSFSVADSREVPTNDAVLGVIAASQPLQFTHRLVKKPQSMTTETFERQLTALRLAFELRVQLHTFVTRPHMMSASTSTVVYKGVVREENFACYFPDLSTLTASAGIVHSRFATNTMPRFENVQPFPMLANNGENNALGRLIQFLENDQAFMALVNVDKIDLAGLSDSYLMSLLYEYYFTQQVSPKQGIASTIQAMPLLAQAEGTYYNTLMDSVPFEGPNASVIYWNGQVYIVRDRNGFRPQVGFISEEYFYSGSEYGTTPISGQLFNLPPAQCLQIDPLTGQYHLHQREQDPQHAESVKRTTMQKTRSYSEPIGFDGRAYALIKARAGWTEEVEQEALQPLFRGDYGNVKSMGYQGPTEAFVSGSMIVLSNCIKAQFAQVTNPPLAKQEESCYMSTETFIGERVSLMNNSAQKPTGLLLPSPIVTNEQMRALIANRELFNTVVIDMTYDIKQRESGLQQRLHVIGEKAVAAVKAGCRLLVLSDVKQSKFNAPIHPVIVSAYVDAALKKANLRGKTGLALQASQCILPRDIAQVTGIGGVDVVNPYLPFIPFDPEQVTDRDYRQRCHHYQEGLRQELMSFMARIGISSFSAYKGAKTFNAVGLDPELTDVLGIPCEYGGIGWQELASIIFLNHKRPPHEDLGIYSVQGGRPERRKSWNPSTIMASIRIAREGKGDVSELEDKFNKLNRGTFRGWLELLPPKKPLPIAILGGGAAGLSVAKELLERGLPVKIHIIEKNPFNPVGLVFGGIFPGKKIKHLQMRILTEVLNDPRVEYFGGVEIGRDVNLKTLQQKFVLINCMGAGEDQKLGIEGEQHVVPASKIYSAYNESDAFSTVHWPFRRKNHNGEWVLIGGGNVSLDIARFLLANPDDLVDTDANPVMIERNSREGPAVVRLVMRSHPVDCKISLTELKHLEEMDIWISARFDDSLIDKNALTPQQQQFYEFFAKYHHNQEPANGRKQLYIHFGLQATQIKEVGKELVIDLDHRFNQKAYQFQVGQVITAIGRQSKVDETITRYNAGWVTGEGGTVNQAADSAVGCADTIVADFVAERFVDFSLDPDYVKTLMAKARTSKHGLLNMRKYFAAGGRIRNVDDVAKAKFPKSTARDAVSTPKIADEQSSQPTPTAPNNGVTVISAGQQMQLAASSTTILRQLREQAADFIPEDECGGNLTCATCVVEVKQPPSRDWSAPPTQADLMRAAGFNPKKHLLSCNTSSKDVEGAVIEVVNPVKK